MKDLKDQPLYMSIGFGGYFHKIYIQSMYYPNIKRAGNPIACQKHGIRIV